MRRAAVATVVATSAALMVAGSITFTAHATNGHVEARVHSFGTDDRRGAYGEADIVFVRQRSIVYNNFRVNDLCSDEGHGDGYPVFIRARAKYRDGTIHYGRKHWDRQGCDDPDGWGPVDGREFNATQDIMKGGVVVCVDKGAHNKCKVDMRDNPHTR